MRIGGTPYGSTGTTGQSLATDYEFDVLYQTATTKLDVINSGGNTLSNCLLVSPNFIFGTDTGIATILNAGNAVRLGNSIKARDIVSYNSFAVTSTAGASLFGVSNSGVLSLIKTTSGTTHNTATGEIGITNLTDGTVHWIKTYQ
ncbi:TPA: hypothetical protein PP061_003653 [Salmonella bongori]|uniref:hypothetical protein n=1 Tax=Salmonella bongori TaxID=54736 RepID=UPI0003EB53DB|nr:hypothetical protein [Salmonella bongori]ECC8733241.1 hypothetical protein [Salmonella bongori]ECE6547216.1 hypothetical protein [Salmonella bongori]ECI3518733.1 hypothetical protein [Salmonella bongori]EDP8575422.1 hypothetical protein [Salmonella bongori]EDP8595102.1 hypothetical protein [Salmonella bongori]